MESMAENPNIFALSRGLMEHAAARQNLIAQNVANADTPGYRAKDLPDFAKTLASTPAFEMRMTRAGHMAPEGGGRMASADFASRFAAEAPNGNDVSLEDQMIRAAEARRAHELGLGVMRNSMEILRATLGRR